MNNDNNLRYNVQSMFNKRPLSVLKNPIQKKEREQRETDRYDRNGTLISSGLKFHVSFKDEISKNERPLCDVIVVESYKEYNLEEHIPQK